MSDIHPIETLYDRLIATFENTSEVTNLRLRSYNETQLNRYIRIDSGDFSTPFSEHTSNEIVLNKRFLILMWCITYIIIEVTQNKSRTAINITDTYIVMDGDDDEVKELDQLFDWAFALKNQNSNDHWPENLPNPALISDQVRVANVIFIDAISYIMFHEVAHIVNGHWESYKEIHLKLVKGEPLDDQDKVLSIQMEQEADNFAYDCLVNSQTDEDTRYHKQLGIILAGLSSMFALKPGTHLNSLTHPSIHVRIFNSREQTAFSEGDEFQLSRVMNVGLSMFCKLHNLKYEDKGFNTFIELLDYFFDILETSGTKALQH